MTEAGFLLPAGKAGAMQIPTQDGFTVPVQAADREERTVALLAAFDERILVMDGATGTALQNVALTAADFGFTDPSDSSAPNALAAVRITTLPAAAQQRQSGKCR